MLTADASTERHYDVLPALGNRMSDDRDNIEIQYLSSLNISCITSTLLSPKSLLFFLDIFGNKLQTDLFI